MSEPGVGLRRAEGGHRGLLDAAEALRDPLADLLAGALAEDRRDGQPGAHDGHADAGIAPEELLVDDRQQQPGGVGVELRQRVEPVEPDLGRLADDRPRRLLALVPFVCGRTHDALGEAVDPVANVLLILGERQRERRLGLLGRRGLFGDGGHSWNVSVQKRVVRRQPRDLKPRPDIRSPDLLTTSDTGSTVPHRVAHTCARGEQQEVGDHATPGSGRLFCCAPSRGRLPSPRAAQRPTARRRAARAPPPRAASRAAR